MAIERARLYGQFSTEPRFFAFKEIGCSLAVPALSSVENKENDQVKSGSAAQNTCAEKIGPSSHICVAATSERKAAKPLYICLRTAMWRLAPSDLRVCSVAGISSGQAGAHVRPQLAGNALPEPVRAIATPCRPSEIARPVLYLRVPSAVWSGGEGSSVSKSMPFTSKLEPVDRRNYTVLSMSKGPLLQSVRMMIKPLLD